MCGLRLCHWLLAISHHCRGSNPIRDIWESCQWLRGYVVIFTGYSGFHHQLQLAGQDLAVIWQKSDEKQNSHTSSFMSTSYLQVSTGRGGSRTGSPAHAKLHHKRGHVHHDGRLAAAEPAPQRRQPGHGRNAGHGHAHPGQHARTEIHTEGGAQENLRRYEYLRTFQYSDAFDRAPILSG